MSSAPKSNNKVKLLVKLDDGQLYVYAKTISHCTAKIFKLKAGQKEIRIQDVNKSDAELFFGSFSGPVSTDATSLCTLMALAAKFSSPKMQAKLSHALQEGSFFDAVVTKPQLIKDLLLTADKFGGSLGSKDTLLQDCVRLSGCLTSEQLAELLPDLNQNTQFAVQKFGRKLQRAMNKKKKEQEPPLHRCDMGTHFGGFPPRQQMADSDEDSNSSVGYHHPESWAQFKEEHEAACDLLQFTHQSGGKWRCSECKRNAIAIDVEEPEVEYEDLMEIEITKGMFKK